MLLNKVLNVTRDGDFEVIPADEMRRKVMFRSPRAGMTVGGGRSVCDAHDANELKSVRSHTKF